MSGLTNTYVDPDFAKNHGVTSNWPDQTERLHPVQKWSKRTLTVLQDNVVTSTSAQISHKTFEPPIATPSPSISADTIPLQIWEGTVMGVDHDAGIMHVLLSAKMGQMPRHAADIDLEWVSEQDEDLVTPGAVFYLTLFKRTKRGGSIENSQELRFRRRPSWTPTQLKRIQDDASRLITKIKALPLAE